MMMTEKRSAEKAVRDILSAMRRHPAGHCRRYWTRHHSEDPRSYRGTATTKSTGNNYPIL